VRETVENLHGPERVVTAITVALRLIRSDPLGQLMFSSIRANDVAWLTGSPLTVEGQRIILKIIIVGDSKRHHFAVVITVISATQPAWALTGLPCFDEVVDAATLKIRAG